MKTFAIVQTPAARLEDSKSFYARLGFKPVRDGARPLVTDGRVAIQINDHKHARTGLVLVAADWKATKEKLASLAELVETEEGVLVSDPNGVRVTLVTDAAFEAPAPAEAFGVLGKFVGIGIESSEMKRSLAFWTALGYEKTAGDPDQGWLGLSADNGVDVNLMKVNMCPHLYPNPGLTYFNSGKNPEVIAKLRKLGVALTQEITCFSKDGSVDNVIINDPGGTGFFVFND